MIYTVLEASVKWNQWVQELLELEHLHFLRSYIDVPLVNQNWKVELHYTRFRWSVRNCLCHYDLPKSCSWRAKGNTLAMTTTRVAPVKKITLTRLELMVAVPMLKMKCIVPLVMLFVGQTNIQLYIVSEDQPHSGNHLLVIVSLRFNRCWIKVSGDIV